LRTSWRWRSSAGGWSKSCAKSETRTIAILEAALDGIVSVDQEGMGTSMAELIIPPELRAGHARGFAHCLATGEGPALDRRLASQPLRADGTVFPAEVGNTRTPVRGRSGFTAFIRDIWGRKVADEERTQRIRDPRIASAAARHRLANILESLGEGFGFDWQWRYVYLNAAAERTIGKSRQDLLGRVVWEVFPEAIGTRLSSALQRTMVEGIPVPTEAISLVTGGLFEVRAYPSEDRLVVYFHDVTERKQAESARVHLAAIVESSEDAIIGTDLDGVVTSWNPGAERLYGYTATEMLGQSLAVLVPPERPNEFPSILERLKTGERIVNYETVRVRKDGQRVDVALSTSPIRDAAGQVVGAARIARDVSSRNRADAIIRRHAALLNIAPVAILARDLQGRVTFLESRGRADVPDKRSGCHRAGESPAIAHGVSSATRGD
jgi:PAS domain S-box-containing protein